MSLRRRALRRKARIRFQKEKHRKFFSSATLPCLASKKTLNKFLSKLPLPAPKIKFRYKTTPPATLGERKTEDKKGFVECDLFKGSVQLVV